MLKYAYLETCGCAANQNNSEIMKRTLADAGMEFVNNEKIADLIILNTCIVKGPTENSIKRRIQDLQKLSKPIIIAGCMPEVRAKELSGKKNLYLLGISHVKDILKLVRRIQENKYKEAEFLTKRKEIKLGKKLRQNKLIGITQISEGCLGNCSYCLVKLVKGNLFSYPEEDIIEQIKEDLSAGCREIWLTSQDNAAYGLDSGTNLINLLRKIIAIDFPFKIRIGMMNPNHVLPILEELLEIYKSSKIYKFLHIPVQSGSNKILRAMNRKYTREQFLDIAKRFKTLFPEGIISTDIIVGYPGETEKDFQETINLLREIKNPVLNMSKYWAMKPTKASLEKQIPLEISKKRITELQNLHLSISLSDNKKYENKELDVFVNEQQGTNCLARDENYRLVVIRSRENLLGKKLIVKIKKSFPHYILGEIMGKR